MSPQPVDGDDIHSTGPATPQSPDLGQPLNVVDVVSYLDAAKMRFQDVRQPVDVNDALDYINVVQMQFQDKPDRYHHFMGIMMDFKNQVINRSDVMQRVAILFHDYPYLIQGFHAFLPPGHRIELSTDPRNTNIITITTPDESVTQNERN